MHRYAPTIFVAAFEYEERLAGLHLALYGSYRRRSIKIPLTSKGLFSVLVTVSYR